MISDFEEEAGLNSYSVIRSVSIGSMPGQDRQRSGGRGSVQMLLSRTPCLDAHPYSRSKADEPSRGTL